jgi:hypothetical protein
MGTFNGDVTVSGIGHTMTGGSIGGGGGVGWVGLEQLSEPTTARTPAAAWAHLMMAARPAREHDVAKSTESIDTIMTDQRPGCTSFLRVPRSVLVYSPVPIT